MRASVSRLLVVLALVFAPAVHAEPRRSDKAEAKAAYESGIHEFGLGNYDDAANDFTRAFDLVGEPAILYNVAQSYRLAQRFEKAAAAYRNFLGHLPPEAQSRAEVEGRIVEMDERAADEKRRAERARIDAQKPIDDVSPSPAVEHETARTHRDELPRTLKIVGYSLCGLTGVALVSGIAMSVLSTHASTDVQNAANAHATFTSSLADTQSRGHAYDRAQIAMYTITGIAAAGAAVSLWFGWKGVPRSSSRAQLLVVPGVGPQGGALTVLGRF